MPKINKILVANRGEIALRIIRAAQELNIKTIAVYSEADRGSLPVRHADEAVCIGPPPSSESYLLGEKIIKVAKESSADAIHPGYGFLSENATFAQQVSDAGLIFIGPSPDSIRLMGNKLTAKEAVKPYGIPLVPGIELPDIKNFNKVKKAASDIGYPLLIKATAGGGGKGMRLVHSEKDLKDQLARASSEASSAFGDSSVFIEKYITNNKHIEIQVLGDQQGNLVHLFERECSIQRRHQKVIEEAPSPVVDKEMRAKMGNAAVKVAQACGYFGAGTVEFIVDQNMNFYFLEMNTRLQVEHPVTEQITGIDLVKEQIAIAEGEKISFDQEDIKLNGHSLEVRVYAEDPENDFLPEVGNLHHYNRPQGLGVRVDDGYEQGMDIPIYYDPMIAKLITFGKDRKEAIQRMNRAIDEFEISGVATTLGFARFVINHPSFVSGEFNTGFVSDHYKPDQQLSNGFGSEDLSNIASALAYTIWEKNRQNLQTLSNNSSKSNWKDRLKYD